MNGEAASCSGTLAGIAAYSLWGVFPLVFHLLASVSPAEVLVHRIVWSFVVVVALLAVRGDHRWVRPLWRERRQLGLLTAAGFLIAVNWLVYIWAVDHGHVVEAALGYYITPLLTVALGVVVLGERLKGAHKAALALGAGSVAVLTAAYGRVPWIAVALALTFSTYGLLKKTVRLGPTASLGVETAVLLPFAGVVLVVLEATGDAAFLHGSGGRDVLLVSLGFVTAVPLLLFGASARRIPLSLLGLLQYLTPTLQLLCGVVLLGERVPPSRWVGFGVVWLALVLLSWDSLRTARLRSRARAAEPALVG
jgi:chloramphenicol-sensitive protein RarD